VVRHRHDINAGIIVTCQRIWNGEKHSLSTGQSLRPTMGSFSSLKLGDRNRSATRRGDTQESSARGKTRNNVAVLAPIRACVGPAGVAKRDFCAAFYGDFSHLSDRKNPNPLPVGGKERAGRALCDGELRGAQLIELARKDVATRKIRNACAVGRNDDVGPAPRIQVDVGARSTSSRTSGFSSAGRVAR